MGDNFGRSIRLFLTDGTPGGVITAQMSNWTGKVVVGRSASLPDLLARAEVKQPGVYILQGPDPDSPSATMVYIGEAEIVAKRLSQHARTKDFWETACVVTVTDESLTKGHIQYLESRLIEMASEAKRVRLDNGTNPTAEKKPLPEADRADMEYFLHYLKVVLPVVGFDFLKPRPQVSHTAARPNAGNAFGEADGAAGESLPIFEIRHRRSGIWARAMEIGDEFVVLEGSEANKEIEYAVNTYAAKRAQLIKDGVLVEDSGKGVYRFTQDTPFSSPSAAGAVILNRNTNGRTKWKLAATGQSYSEWQDERRRVLEGDFSELDTPVSPDDESGEQAI